jgi:uncharacterized protein YjbI with pentapeptide repeats
MLFAKFPGSAMRSAASAALFAGLVLLAGNARAADCDSSPAPGLDWSQCSKSNIMLEGSNFEGANLSESDLSVTDFSNSNLNGAKLRKANLVRAWFTGSTAEKADFSRIQAYRSGFSNVKASGSTFASAELERANFTGADLTGTDFEKAELGRAVFDNAVLTGTKFTLANLSRADLHESHFKGRIDFDRAFMFLTRIEGLDLSEATGLQQAQIELACGDPKTKLPKGLTTPSSWPCDSD